MSMSFKSKYVETAVDTILKMDPTLDAELVRKTVIKSMKQDMSNPTIIMDNNVTKENLVTNLVDLCHWIDTKCPVVSGNATFYVQPEVLQSPTSNMLRSLKKERKSIKGEMFKYKPSDDKYAMLDLGQSNVKVVMNAEYGGSGAPTAAFYTKYSPAATTLMAQSIITTMAAFFEGYIGDNMKFFHINECIDWLNHICAKEDEIPKWVVIPSRDEIRHRIISHFMPFDIKDTVTINAYIDNCTDSELCYIFYANNLHTFIERHDKVKNIIRDVLSNLPLYEASEDTIPDEFKNKFSEINKYNDWVSREMFLDPYTIPDIIKNEMTKLVEIVTQMCFVNYLTPDSIIKLNNHFRNRVLLVDTDSNVLYTNEFVTFILDAICKDETFNRNRLYNEMITVNILATLLDTPVKKILDTYGILHNANADARKEMTMKNEFLFKRFLLMQKKKRYASSIVLREGHIMVPYKTEIKGLDFIKAGVSDHVTKVFTKMLEKYILFSEELQLHELMREVKRFEKEIYHDLKQGGTQYLKPQSYKSGDAYKKPWSVQVYKAVAVWNAMYPNNKIYSLDKVKLVKTVVTGLQDLDKIKDKYPEEYKLIYNNIFKSSDPELIKAGMKVIAIPSTIHETPEWIRELIDYTTIISDVCSSFRSVLDAFKLETIPIKTPNGKANITTSLISL
jgi:hypothetical protein